VGIPEVEPVAVYACRVNDGVVSVDLDQQVGADP
jgi:hypothetical protein